MTKDGIGIRFWFKADYYFLLCLTMTLYTI